MYIIFILFLLLATLILLAYLMPLNIIFVFDSDAMNMQLSMTWLKKLNIRAEIIRLKPHISVFLFNKKLVSFIKEKKKKRSGVSGIIKSLELNDTNVKMFYGFDKPFMTGIIFSVLGFITSLFRIDRFEQYPEFVPANEYLKIEATTQMNIGKTISKLILLKLKK